MVQQIRLRTLLREDPVFKAWFVRPPQLTIAHSTPPWRLYVQKEEGGKWARADLREYVRALEGVKSRLPEVWDMTIHSKGQRFKPPVIHRGKKNYYMPMPEGHRWCELCRRPTVFRRFKRHPAVPITIDTEEQRCTICGARRAMTRPFFSPLIWPATSDIT